MWTSSHLRGDHLTPVLPLIWLGVIKESRVVKAWSHHSNNNNYTYNDTCAYPTDKQFYCGVVTPHRYPNLDIGDPCRCNLPEDKAVPGPHELGDVLHIIVIVGDKAFPLKQTLLWPYPGHNLEYNVKCSINCRLSRACRIVEKALQPLLHDCVRSLHCTYFHAWKSTHLLTSHINTTWLAQIFHWLGLGLKNRSAWQSHWHQ